MVNIAIVTTWFDRGAAYVSKSYKQVLEKNNKVFIYARGGERYGIGDRNWDLPYVTWSPWFGKTYISRYHFYRWLKKNKIEVIIFNEQKMLEPVEMAKEIGCIVGAYVDYYTEDTLNDFYIYDFLICNTLRHYSVFRNHPNCLYVPWGTDTKIFQPQNLDGLVSGDYVTFFHSAGMGGINLRKGTDLLVKAFQKVKHPAKLVIHSQVGLERYGRNIARLVSNDSRIKFIHGTFSAPGLYHVGDVYVYPSKLEGIGLTICEALSCGLPVITTDSPPMNEFVKDGEHGALVKVKEVRKRADNYYWPETYVDIDDLSEKMIMYAKDKELVLLQKRAAREYALKFRDWYRNAEGLGKGIEKIVESVNRGEKNVSKATEMEWILELFIFYLKTMVRFKKIDLRSLKYGNLLS